MKYVGCMYGKATFMTSNKFLNAWGKIISEETLLDEICGLHVWKGYIYKS